MTALNEPAIVFESVTKSYKKKEETVTALDCVSFTVDKGALVAIVGPSGSGKTTILNLTAALDFPTQGSVTVAGVGISKLAKEDLQKFRNETVGVIFQQFFLIDHLTVFENVMIPLIPRSMPSAEKSKRILGAIAQVGLESKSGRLPSELSGGEVQRAAIARGIVGDPSVLLADEPTGNLDVKRGLEIMDILAMESKEKGKTVLVATHDLRVLDKADGIIYLEDGRIAKIEGNRVKGNGR